MQLITSTPCVVAAYIHVCEHGHETVKHYVFFDGDQDAAAEMMTALAEAETRPGVVMVSYYEGSLYPNMRGSMPQ